MIAEHEQALVDLEWVSYTCKVQKSITQWNASVSKRENVERDG